jgi:Flp pilus assembly protein TadG
MGTIFTRAPTTPKKGAILMLRRNLREETGQALVELALVVPLFTVILFGAVEYGRLAYAAIEVTNAARAGAAYGAQTHVTAADTAGIQTAATQDAPNLTGVVATVTNTCSCSDGTSGVTCTNAGTTCISPARILETVQVNTTATVNVGASFTLHGVSNMRVLQ